MAIKDTSIIAYHDITETGVATTQKERVFLAVKSVGEVTRQELSVQTELPINVVCGRINELIKEGRLFEFEPRPCRITGRLARPVSTTRLGHIDDLFPTLTDNQD